MPCLALRHFFLSATAEPQSLLAARSGYLFSDVRRALGSFVIQIRVCNPLDKPAQKSRGGTVNDGALYIRRVTIATSRALRGEIVTCIRGNAPLAWIAATANSIMKPPCLSSRARS